MSITKHPTNSDGVNIPAMNVYRGIVSAFRTLTTSTPVQVYGCGDRTRGTGRTQMKNPRRMLLFVVIALFLTTSASPSTSAATFVVGTCRPSLPSYVNISAAVAAAPAGSTGEGLPGTYPQPLNNGEEA